MRWTHPKLGNVPPGKFIPRAEQSTLIDMLTEWAIDTALAQLVEWKKSGIVLSVAVNISTRNLLQPDFAVKVLKLLDRHKVKGASLELEVTEWGIDEGPKICIRQYGSIDQCRYFFLYR